MKAGRMRRNFPYATVRCFVAYDLQLHPLHCCVALTRQAQAIHRLTSLQPTVSIRGQANKIRETGPCIKRLLEAA